MNIPKLRFPEFKENWETNNLGEIAVFSKGKGISKADIVEDGNIECIRYGELYTTYGETIEEVKSRTNIYEKDLQFSEANDVIIPASGETKIDIATASCVLRSGIALGGDLNIIKTANNGVFLSYYLNSKKKLEIANFAQGVSVVHLYSSQLALLGLNLPKIPEQDKIALFFSAIDEKLQALKKKKSLLEHYKKGVMQKIFSQELRFKDENGNEFPRWEVKKLGEIAKITTGSSNREDSNLDGEYTFFDRSQDIRSSNRYLFDAEAIIVPGEGQVFVPKYFKGKFDLHQRTYAIMDFKDIDGIFLFYSISYNTKHLDSHAVGSTVKSLRLPMFESMPINLPSLPEQTKISVFLSSLDEKIQAVQVQIEKTELWKKGLLQKMFV